MTPHWYLLEKELHLTGMYANILITVGRKCFHALCVQQGDAFSLLSTSSNAIPLNLHSIVACAAFSGDETTSVVQSRN